MSLPTISHTFSVPELRAMRDMPDEELLKIYFEMVRSNEDIRQDVLRNIRQMMNEEIQLRSLQ